MNELYVGTLSGTSMDGIDAALVRFAPQPQLEATHTLAYPPELRAELLALAVPGENEIDRMGQADVRVGKLFGQAVNELLAHVCVAASEVTAIGSHGQTIRHRPKVSAPFTLQIGDPNVIAAETGIAVAADFRRKDMALGGQGAPLVPAFHAAIFQKPGVNRVIVNIGGIANVTILSGETVPVRGFDTGPGNTLLDGWARRVLGTPMDYDGALAARGRVSEALLHELLTDEFFRAAPPKSTGPEHFSTAWLEQRLARARGNASDTDVQATLMALTAQSIADAIRVERVQEVFVCGGGARNPVLMRALAERLPGCTVAATDTLGVAAGWVEAMAFAWLAFQRRHERPGNCPEVTGARRAAVLGGWFLPQ